jgi:hypothetical protein
MGGIQQDKGKFFALLVGVDDSDEGPGGLSHCVRDAKKMQATLLHLGYPESNVQLTDNVDAAGFRDAVRVFADQVNGVEHATVLVYYAGHGVQHDGDTLLWPRGVDSTCKCATGSGCCVFLTYWY